MNDFLTFIFSTIIVFATICLITLMVRTTFVICERNYVSSFFISSNNFVGNIFKYINKETITTKQGDHYFILVKTCDGLKISNPDYGDKFLTYEKIVDNFDIEENHWIFESYHSKIDQLEKQKAADQLKEELKN